MRKALLFLIMAVCLPAVAEAPSTATLVLSLKTISKALAGCRQVYETKKSNSSIPLIKAAIGSDPYDRDMQSLTAAEKLTNGLIQNPGKITGRFLVAILSTSDDLSVGIGSTRMELLRNLLKENSGISAEILQPLMSLDVSLADCQKSLFNAADDYVDLVMKYVGSEDEKAVQVRH